MNLLQLIGITNTFQSCAECGHLIQPAIRARNVGTNSTGFHCFRCYHILAAVRIFQNVKDAQHGARKPKH